jgi:hypothetical protein
MYYVQASAKLQKEFLLLGPFRHFLAGKPARKLVQAIKYLQVKKLKAQNTQTGIKDIHYIIIYVFSLVLLSSLRLVPRLAVSHSACMILLSYSVALSL